MVSFQVLYHPKCAVEFMFHDPCMPVGISVWFYLGELRLLKIDGVECTTVSLLTGQNIEKSSSLMFYTHVLFY